MNEIEHLPAILEIVFFYRAEQYVLIQESIESKRVQKKHSKRQTIKFD